MSVVRVKVPASTANLGPGFDCLGIALQIYNWITIKREASNHPDAMVEAAASAFFRRTGERSFPFGCRITGEVPRSRGLGSSVTVRLGVLHGLNELAGSPLSRQEVFELCTELEGHPDNAAPAAFGGFTIARGDGYFQRYRVDRELGFALLIPDFEMSTSDARKVLPKAVSLGDAVASVSNACAIAGAFASRDYEKLSGCFGDRLHQPFRAKWAPVLSPVIDAGTKAGALGGWLSGAGSTVACLALRNVERVAGAMLAACGLSGARIVTTRADNTGVRIYLRN
ncbi:MAG: homoserine kinase [Terrimicrobiaceae bacterium]